MSKTKIVGTLGPATDSVEIIKDLIDAGLSAARINFSHGTYESHGIIIDMLKKARVELGKPVALILDTKGPEIRIKKFDKEEITLKQGNTFTLTTRDIVGNEEIVAVTYKNLPKDLKVGSRVLIDDGLIELKVKEIDATDINCEIINSGTLSSNKGVNVPDVYVNLPSLTDKDKSDIMFGIEKGFDFIAASFIRSANDVSEIRKILDENNGTTIDIIAKIESRDGVNNIDEILNVADGIMVARGDLGVEIPPEEVPLVQKDLIAKANRMGKIVITATQMLESMVNNPRPTRAEANDVANAILDGTDAIMLSGETAKGKYPVEAVKMMTRIANTTETSINYGNLVNKHTTDLHTTVTNAISYATCTTAADLNASCIVPVTASGFSARMVSRFRPACPILAITESKHVYRKLNLTWGCIPVLTEEFNFGNNEEVFERAASLVEKLQLAKAGDAIVIVAGVPVGIAGTTNTLKVEIVGNILAKGTSVSVNRSATGTTRVVKYGDVRDIEFEKGDILVTNKTTDEVLKYMKMASAVIVGSGTSDMSVHSHVRTVGKTLDLPVLVCYEKVEDLVPSGIFVTVDTDNGFIYNGLRNN